MIAEVAEDIVQYIELPHLQNHILAIDDPSLHSTLQVLLGLFTLFCSEFHHLICQC